MSMPNNPFDERDPYQWDQPQPIVPSGLWKFLTVFVVLLVICGILGGLIVAFVGKKAANQQDKKIVKRLPSGVNREAKKKFNLRKFVPPKQNEHWHDIRPIAKLLDKVAVTIRKRDWVKFRTCLAITRHAKRVAEKGDLQYSHFDKMVTTLKTSWGFPLSISRQTIAHIDFSTSPIRQATIYTYTQEQRSDHWRMRWELVHEAGRWKVLDWDVLDWNQSESTQNAEFYVTTGEFQREHFATWSRELQKFYNLSRGKNQDLQKALTVAKNLGQQIVRPVVRGVVELRTGNCYRDLGYSGIAVGHYRRAQALGLPGANRDLANFYFEKAMYKPALVAASVYLEQLGSGPWVHSLIARSHLGLGNLKKARSHLQMALECDPNYSSALEDLARTIGSADDGELERRILATKDPVESRLTVVTKLAQWGNVKAANQMLSPLLQKRKEKKLDKKVAKRVFDIHIRNLQADEKLKQAIALRRQRWEAAKKETEKTARLRELHRTIFSDGKVKELFRLSPDPRAAILYIMDADEDRSYATDEPPDKEFLAEYARKHPKDFLGPYATAKLVLSSFPARAERVDLLRKALSLLKKSEETWRKQIRRLLMESLLDLNKLDEAYKLVRPKDSNGLYELANHCVYRRDWASLRAVMTRYSKDNPGKSSQDLAFLKCREDAANEKHQAVVDRLAKVDKSKILKSQLYTFDRLQRQTHIRLGKVTGLLAKSKDKWQTYRQLVASIRRVGTPKQSEALSLAFLAQTSDNNRKAEAFYNLCDYQWQTKKYGQLCEALKDWPRNELVSLRAYQRSTLADRLVRSYIRQNNTKEAILAAKRIAGSTGETKPLVIAALAEKNGRLATDALVDCWDPVSVTTSLRGDQDVGKMVRDSGFIERTQFVPRLFNRSFGSEWLVLLKSAPDPVTLTDLRSKLKGFKDLGSVDKFESDWTKREQMDVFLLNSKEQLYTISFCRKPLKSKTQRQTAPQRRIGNLVDQHKGWVSIRTHLHGSRRWNVDKTVSLARHLRFKNSLVLVHSYRAAAVTKALKDAIAKNVPIKQIQKQLTEYTSLASPIPRRKYLRQGEFFAMEDAFRNLKPGQQLQVAFNLSVRPVTESMWLTVEQIQYSRYYYRREFIGKVEKKPRLLTHLATPRKIRLSDYQIEKYRIVSSPQ